MSTIPKEKLDKLVGRWNAIQAELNAGVNQAVYTKLTKEFAGFEPYHLDDRGPARGREGERRSGGAAR